MLYSSEKQIDIEIKMAHTWLSRSSSVLKYTRENGAIIQSILNWLFSNTTWHLHTNYCMRLHFHLFARERRIKYYGTMPMATMKAHNLIRPQWLVNNVFDFSKLAVRPSISYLVIWNWMNCGGHLAVNNACLTIVVTMSIFWIKNT